MTKIFKRLSRGDLITLFLVVAFPIHAWSIYMIMQDFQWVMERTVSVWDAIGYSSYSLDFALFESSVLFLVVLLFSFLLPSHWKANKTLAGISIVFFSVSFWAIINQLFFFYYNTSFVSRIPQIFVASAHPVRWFYLVAGGIVLLVLGSILVPLFFINRSSKFTKTTLAVIDRLVILSGLYIVLDIFGFIIIVIRNL